MGKRASWSIGLQASTVDRKPRRQAAGGPHSPGLQRLKKELGGSSVLKSSHTSDGWRGARQRTIRVHRRPAVAEELQPAEGALKTAVNSKASHSRAPPAGHLRPSPAWSGQKRGACRRYYLLLKCDHPRRPAWSRAWAQGHPGVPVGVHRVSTWFPSVGEGRPSSPELPPTTSPLAVFPTSPSSTSFHYKGVSGYSQSHLQPFTLSIQG